MVANLFSRLTDIRNEEFPVDDSFPDDKSFMLIRKETP